MKEMERKVAKRSVALDV